MSHIIPRCEYDQSIIHTGLPSKAISPVAFGRFAFRQGIPEDRLLELMAAGRMVNGVRAPVDPEDVSELDHLTVEEEWRAESEDGYNGHDGEG